MVSLNRFFSGQGISSAGAAQPLQALQNPFESVSGIGESLQDVALQQMEQEKRVYQQGEINRVDRDGRMAVVDMLESWQENPPENYLEAAQEELDRIQSSVIGSIQDDEVMRVAEVRIQKIVDDTLIEARRMERQRTVERSIASRFEVDNDVFETGTSPGFSPEGRRELLEEVREGWELYIDNGAVDRQRTLDYIQDYERRYWWQAYANDASQMGEAFAAERFEAGDYDFTEAQNSVARDQIKSFRSGLHYHDLIRDAIQGSLSSSGLEAKRRELREIDQLSEQHSIALIKTIEVMQNQEEAQREQAALNRVYQNMIDGKLEAARRSASVLEPRQQYAFDVQIRNIEAEREAQRQREINEASSRMFIGISRDLIRGNIEAGDALSRVDEWRGSGLITEQDAHRLESLIQQTLQQEFQTDRIDMQDAILGTIVDYLQTGEVDGILAARGEVLDYEDLRPTDRINLHNSLSSVLDAAQNELYQEQLAFIETSPEALNVDPQEHVEQLTSGQGRVNLTSEQATDIYARIVNLQSMHQRLEQAVPLDRSNTELLRAADRRVANFISQNGITPATAKVIAREVRGWSYIPKAVDDALQNAARSQDSGTVWQGLVLYDKMRLAGTNHLIPDSVRDDLMFFFSDTGFSPYDESSIQNRLPELINERSEQRRMAGTQQAASADFRRRVDQVAAFEFEEMAGSEFIDNVGAAPSLALRRFIAADAMATYSTDHLGRSPAIHVQKAVENVTDFVQESDLGMGAALHSPGLFGRVWNLTPFRSDPSNIEFAPFERFYPHPAFVDMARMELEQIVGDLGTPFLEATGDTLVNLHEGGSPVWRVGYINQEGRADYLVVNGEIATWHFDYASVEKQMRSEQKTPEQLLQERRARLSKRAIEGPGRSPVTRP